MLSDRIHQRLEALNRQRLPVAQQEPAAKPSVAVSTRPAPSPIIAKPAPARVVQNELGEHLLYTHSVADYWPAGPRLVAGRIEHLQSRTQTSDMQALVDALPDRALLLDLETCGLAGAALFLVGLLRWIDNQPTIELLMARNWSEEPAVLGSLWSRLVNTDVLVTYNGKSFDWPMVMDRSRRHLLHKRWELSEPAHFDLLHPARRKWRSVLPDCKLQTIEQRVCRRPRGADIPGNQIPAAYDAYVRTGQDDQMQQVRRHNAQDLVTLLDIAMRVVE